MYCRGHIDTFQHRTLQIRVHGLSKAKEVETGRERDN